MITQIETNGNAHSNHQQQQQQQQYEPNQIRYSVILKYNPTVPKAGQPTLITIKIIENQTEKRVKQFDLLHEKLMHIIIVSEDFSYFLTFILPLTIRKVHLPSLINFLKLENTKYG